MAAPFPPAFAIQIRYLGEAAGRSDRHGALPGLDGGGWDLPPTAATIYDVQAPETPKAAYDRADLNAYYGKALAAAATPGSYRVGHLGAAKAAVDYLACAERAVQARYASRVRAWCWSAGRRRGHADVGDGVFGAVVAEVRESVDAGTSVDNRGPSQA